MAEKRPLVNYSGNMADLKAGDTLPAVAASDTVAGVQENAIASEINTGTATTLTVTPDALAGSVFGEKSWSIAITESDTDSAVADGKVGMLIPAALNGMNLVAVVSGVHTAGTTGTTDVQARRRRVTTDADMLSTKLTIDSGETTSKTAATPAVINAANDDLATGDIIFFDVDAISTTPAKGLVVTATARLP